VRVFVYAYSDARRAYAGNRQRSGGSKHTSKNRVSVHAIFTCVLTSFTTLPVANVSVLASLYTYAYTDNAITRRCFRVHPSDALVVKHQPIISLSRKQEAKLTILINKLLILSVSPKRSGQVSLMGTM